MSQSVVQKAPAHGEKALLMHSAEDAGRVKLPQLRSTVEVDRSRPLPTSLQADFLPDNILLALTQPPIARDKLGPPSLQRNLATSNALARAPAANVWSHKRKEKFKHLLEATSCSCGAGKDISFLYDVAQQHGHPEKPDTIDQSAVRKNAEIPPKKALQLPDTLIPDEYHIVKNRGVMGIEYHEDKYTTNPEDHENHLVVFPSLKPSSRFEVLQLKKTMEDMLEKVGFNDDEMEVKGPTQMHNLLELVKKEQNIYNIIFHELIRQTSVECTERGQLLAEVRGKYSQLLTKVPQQIMGLHEEVMAQRALDRRLTEELMRFKNTIALLTSELSDVKEHDKIVTREAQKTQEDLRHALTEAQKNAALLSEYHDLYELQRRRLEHQVFVLSEEREIWSTAAYSLALKVTEECRLTTAKRLHVSEKAWAKLANHFTILLSDRDTDLLTKIQTHVERWRDAIEDFNIALRQREEEMKETLKTVRGYVETWMLHFRCSCFNKDGHLVKPPDKAKMEELQQDLRTWEKMLAKESEVFGGDLLLSNQEELTQIRKEMEGWTDDALVVFSRHRGIHNSIHADQIAMIKLNDEVEHLLKQYQLRISGENGVAGSVIHLQNMVEMWETRVIAALNGTVALQDNDWVNFYQGLEEWLTALDQTTLYVGTTLTEEERQEGKAHLSIDIHDVVRKTQKWATTSSNSIDSEDAKLVEQVSTLHSEMVRWMVQTLLRLAPDKKGNSREAAHMALLGSVSVPQLHENVKQLFESLSAFSNYVTLCCDSIVKENTQKRQDQNEDNPEHEMKDLQRLRTECEDWICTAQILMSQLTGESIEELFPKRASTTLSKSSKQEPIKEDSGIQTPQAKIITTAPSYMVNLTQPEEEPEAKIEDSHGSNQDSAGSAEDSSEAVPSSDLSKTVSDITIEEHKHLTLEVFRGDGLEVLGGDRNTHMAGLKDKGEPTMATSPVKTEGAPDTKRAFEALATVNVLQDQLLMTEQRAQEAEERATTAETELASAQEMIRNLQKKVEKMSSGESETPQEADQSAQTTYSSLETLGNMEREDSQQSLSSEPGRSEAKTKTRGSRRPSGKSKKQK